MASQPDGSQGGGVGAGLCSVCGALFKLVPSSGVLRRHGHGHGRPPCQGSGAPPATQPPPPSLDNTSGDLFEDSLSSLTTPSTITPPALDFRRPPRATLKRIPRGARQGAARLFEKRLNAVSRRPDDRGAWRDLLQFGGCLAQPLRGGKRNNLTSSILAQIDRVDRGQPAQEEGPGGIYRQGRKVRHHGADDLDREAARRASMKLDAGDVRGAVRMLCSDETLAPHTQANVQLLRDKHPPPPSHRRPFPPTTSAPMFITSDDLRRAIHSFSPGSAGGQDGLRPQHLVDMTDARVSGTLRDSLVTFTNLVLAGGVPLWARSCFFGATLHAFNKKGGGIRPIAVGLTLRRLVAKVACARATESCSAVLMPRQLGVGVKGGAEALAHAARRYLASMEPACILVKLDFTNAFNTIRRDAVLEAVARHVPDLLPFASSAYGSASDLHLGVVLESAEGVQQGDPLGPLLFCLALADPLSKLNADFISGYLDDIGLGGPADSIAREVKAFEKNTKEIGLHLNYCKCEVIGLSPSSRATWAAAGLTFQETKPETATLLGTPIHQAGVDDAVKAKRDLLESAVPRLKCMSGHEALFLLSHSLAIPRLQYLLRTAPCFLSKEPERFDDMIMNTLSTCLNIRLGSTERVLASQPVRWGGLGLRSATDLAPSCFLASVSASASLLDRLLPVRALSAPDGCRSQALTIWTAMSGSAPPTSSSDIALQRAWDDPICKSHSEMLISRANDADRARLLAGQATGSGAWLHALPSSALGLRLGDDEVRMAAGLRLGVQLVRAHTCVCGVPVAPNGHHGLSCKRSAGRHLRHRLANDVIARAFRSAEVPVEVEPLGLLRNDGKRPDGVTIVPWANGRCTVWDFTCPDTLAPSHINHTSRAAGSAAETAESNKRVKYSGLGNAYNFVPFAVETLGAWGPDALALSSALGSRLAAALGEPRSTAFLRQRLDIAIQRGNAAAIRGSIPAGEQSE